MAKAKKRNKIKIAPSILSADFSQLAKDIDKVRNADMLHIDVMDGHFVNNITIGPVVVDSIKEKARKLGLSLDVHLMIEKPEKYLEQFAKAGAKIITFHPVASKNPKATIAKIKKLGCKAGISINPDKPLSVLKPYLKDADMVLIMSVYAGFSGQKFMPGVLKKVRALRKLGFKKDIEIDGGINDDTVKQAAKAGANVFVAGSYVFGNKNSGKVVELLRRNANAHSQK